MRIANLPHPPARVVAHSDNSCRVFLITRQVDLFQWIGLLVEPGFGVGTAEYVLKTLSTDHAVPFSQTASNTTDRERAGVAFHFLQVDSIDHDSLSDPNHAQSFLVGLEATGGEAEYGVRVAGTWETEVARVLAANAN